MKYVAYCPCCNKELDIEIIESDGEMTAALSYKQDNAVSENTAIAGYEFGTIKRKTIFNSGVARRLIQMGNCVVDIKPLKENPDKSAFVFSFTEKCKNDISKLSN